MNNSITQSFSVPYSYKVHFTQGVFDLKNSLFKNIVEKDKKLLFVIDQGVINTHPTILKDIDLYCEGLVLCGEKIIIPGGEAAKNDIMLVDSIISAVNDFGIDRHSYIVAIGGGAVIDMAGFAAAIAHRGIKLIRIPTTVLAQNDAAVGVKNSVNTFGKKNFTGTFAPPHAVINDFDFLLSLSDRDWRSGIAEAIKVSLIKDKSFFESIKENAGKLASRDIEAMQALIYKCAEMHLQHIAGGDPFEQGSSRPLDFGHWAAHKLEYLSGYELRHGEAVAIGIALDSTYSYLDGRITEDNLNEILNVLHKIGFSLYDARLLQREADGTLTIIKGLQEFREHLGGKLTITLLHQIGKGIEVNEMDEAKIERSIFFLKKFYETLL